MNYFSLEQAQQICAALRSAGQLAQQMAASNFQVSEKGPEDYVTEVDRLLDRQLSAAFSNLFPQDGVITEENAQSRSALSAGYDRLWLIDPLDGTEDFIYGKREYAVMVGLLQASTPLAGWVYAPEFQRLYYGGQNWGLFQEIGDRPVEPLLVKNPPPLTSDPCPMILGSRDQKNYGVAITQHIPNVQFYTLGSFGLKVLEVIQGRAGLYVYLNGRVKLWDTTGPLTLAKLAGMVCCDLAGEPIHFSPDALNLDTLAHRQAIVVGWPDYVDTWRPKIQAAVQTVKKFGSAFPYA